MDDLKVHSNIPASDLEAMTEAPFVFEVAGESFAIQPFTFQKYLQMERFWKQSVISLIYARAGWDEAIAKALDINKTGMNAIGKATAFTQIIAKACEPMNQDEYESFKRRVRKIVWSHNKSNWKHPSWWVLSLAGWLECHLVMSQIIRLAGHISQYMAQKKTILLSILQNPAIGATTHEQPISRLSIAQQSMRAALDPGYRKSLTTR